MATTPSIADQLRSYQQSLEYANRTAESIQEQRDLLKEVASQARRINVEFNKSTENIGDSVKEIKMFESIEADLNNVMRDRNVIESSLLKQVKSRARTEEQLNLARRLMDPITKAVALRELATQKEIIRDQLNSGNITRSQARLELSRLNALKNNTSTVAQQLLRQSDAQDGYIIRTRENLKLENARLDRLKAQNGFMQLGKKVLGDMGPLGDKIISFKSITAASLLTDILEHGYKNFLAFDKAATAARMNLGALSGQANSLEKNIKTVALDLSGIGATFDDVAASAKSLTDSFGSLVARDKQLLTTTTALSKQFGITGDTSAKFLETLGGISGKSAKSQLAMTGFAQKIAVAAGVPLGKIMEDVANASDEVRIYVGSSAVSMIKAAAAARMMGIDLNKAAASADKLLQFESSISAELKASALLGQSVNFNYARQLAFNKNIIGANKEILKITKQVNFNQLNPIQQKAYADAAGKSVGELQSMLQQEKNIQLVKNGTNKEAKAALADYERLMQMKDGEAKKEGEIAEQEIIRKANQERMIQIQNQFNKLMNELSKPVMDIVEPLLDLAIIVLPKLLDGFRILVGYSTMFSAFKFLMTLPRMVNAVLGALRGGQGIVMTFSAPFKALSRSFGPILKFLPALGKLGPLLAPIMKVAGPIGLIIAAIQSVFSIFDTVKSAIKDFTDGNFLAGIIKIFIAIPKAVLDVTVGVLYDLSRLVLGWFGVDLPNGMWNGIKDVGDMLFEGMLKPFKGAWDWIKSIFVGNSPSELGLGIVRGIKSVGGMILDALIGPFVKGYNFISKFIPGTSEMKMPSEVLSDITGDTKKSKETINAAAGEGNLLQTIQAGNQQLAQKLDTLINLMANGGIAVNLDGQRINAALSTTILKSGGFGQATTRG